MKSSPQNSDEISRRGFLAAAGLAAMGAALGRAEGSAPGASPAGSEAAPGGLVGLVNILQGTNSSREYSRGNTLPIAALPFGMAHWTLQSQPGHGWFFNPADQRIQGFRSTHQLSPWLGDYGYATFLPFSGGTDPDPAKRATSYKVETAHLSPASIKLFLLRYRVEAELIPTPHCATIVARFETQEAPGFLFDVPGEWDSGGSAAEVPQTARQTLAFAAPDRQSLGFTASFGASGMRGAFATFYVLTFSRPWKSISVAAAAGSRLGTLAFGPSEDALEVRIGTSFISIEQAAASLGRETSGRSAGELRTAAAQAWNDHLGRIQVEGASRDQLRTLYSCMYRALLFPRQWHEIDASGATVHRSAYNGKVEPGVMYADHGYWDVYRAWYPWMSVLFPERLGEILQAWVNAFREGGWLPQFPAPGYRSCMTGSLIDAVFGDAAAKGLGGFDLAGAYEGLRKHATRVGNPKAGYGRRGLEDYLKLGYVPADRVGQSAAETVDAAYGDFCIAQVARALGHGEDFTLFMKRSQNWRNLFDPKTGFLRGRNSDGSWVEPFDPIAWGGAHVEGSAWQHRWDVPHDVAGLFDALGGKARAAEELEKMLTMEPAFHVGSYGREIHEMSEMAAADFGQYAHSNQPVHHVLYLFAAAGRPDRTRYWADRVMKELYTADTFPGDEDTGSMAAWFLLSAGGFFSACPGKPEYTLGSPLFRRMTLHLSGGKTFTIATTGGDGSIRTVRLNGSPHAGTTLDHRAVMAGGTLEFERSTA